MVAVTHVTRRVLGGQLLGSAPNNSFKPTPLRGAA